MKFSEDGLEEYDLIMNEVRKPDLRITYRVPWCEVCGNHVDKFEVAHNTPSPGRDTLVAHCHGRTHEKIINSDSAVGKERTDVFFDLPKFQTLSGFNTKRRIGKFDHDMYEIDRRMKSLGIGYVGTGGEIVQWKKKR